jgi:parvulin-like peptidyl-prolyl isomerase
VSFARLLGLSNEDNRRAVVRGAEEETMSAVCILTPIVVAAWPAFSAVVAAAATSLGYSVVAEGVDRINSAVRGETAVTQQRVQLEIANSQLVTGQLERDQRVSVTRGGVTVTFSRDARGRAEVCVTGTGQTDEALRAFGEELSQRVVQRYVYQRVMDELRAQQFTVVEEEVEADQSIRLKVRRWEG